MRGFVDGEDDDLVEKDGGLGGEGGAVGSPRRDEGGEVGVDGGFVQRVRPTPEGAALLVEARAADEASAGALASSEASSGFELLGEAARVLRCTLVRVGGGAAEPSRWLLLLTVHHVAYDDSSRSVLHGELGALYAALSAGGGAAARRGSTPATWRASSPRARAPLR